MVAALEEFGAARRAARRLAADDPGNAVWPRKLAHLEFLIGFVQARRGQLDPALAALGSALAAYRYLMRSDPTRAEWRERLAETLRFLGIVSTQRNDAAAAFENCREALTLLEELVAEDPTGLSRLESLARVHQTIAFSHLSLGATTEAIAAFETAQLTLERLVEIADNPFRQNQFSLNHLLLGNVYGQRELGEEARREWRRALEIIAPVAAGSEVLEYRSTHARTLLRLGRVDEARPLATELLARGWKEPQFLQLARDSGLETIGAP